MIPNATRQTYRQLQIPAFQKKERLEENRGKLYAEPMHFASAFPQAQGEIPTGYGLELFSLYHPVLIRDKPVLATVALALATKITVAGRMALSRRGELLWEGSPQLTVFQPYSKTVHPTSWFLGAWGVQFQNPLLIQSPGELELQATLLLAIANSEAEYPIENEWAILGEAEEEWQQAFTGEGSIGYSLVKI